MFLESFRITGSAMAQIILLGAIGYFLTRKNILGEAGLDALSRLTIDVTLPLLIFCQLIKDFSFSMYQNWWIFPLLSLLITVLGLGVGSVFVGFIRGGAQQKLQFLSLTGFQNSGYLPLVLLAALLPQEKLGPIFIYLFLFLLGFNLVMFSLGLYMLAFSHKKKFELSSLLSAPVIATITSLVFVFFGLNKFVPKFIFTPLKMIGDSTLPLAMLVVGGNLAKIHLGRVDKKAVALLTLVKLIILPALGLLVIIKFNVPPLIGLLVLLELAVPSATTLSVILRLVKKEDLLVSQGIFFSHIFSIITLPLFLSVYFMIVMIK